MILTVWLAGATFWVVIQSVRAIRFHRLVVRGATTNREVPLQTEELSAAMGLRCGPRLLLVEATVSPMLWRAKLLFPFVLVQQLDEAARATLLTHELAHFVRGDHWVRLLELIETPLFWLHPVVWWARH